MSPNIVPQLFTDTFGPWHFSGESSGQWIRFSLNKDWAKTGELLLIYVVAPSGFVPIGESCDFKKGDWVLALTNKCNDWCIGRPAHLAEEVIANFMAHKLMGDLE